MQAQLSKTCERELIQNGPCMIITIIVVIVLYSVKEDKKVEKKKAVAKEVKEMVSQ